MINKNHKHIVSLKKARGGSYDLKIQKPGFDFRSKEFLIGAALLLVVVGLVSFLVHKAFFKEEWSELNYQQGLKNLSEGKFEKAADNFEKVSSGKNESDALYKLGVSKYNQKDFEGALAVFEEILEENPKNPDAHNGIGNIYRDQKNYSKAEDSYKKAIAFDSGYTIAYSNWAIMLMDEGKIQDAGEVVRDGLEKNSESIELTNLKKILEESRL